MHCELRTKSFPLNVLALTNTEIGAAAAVDQDHQRPHFISQGNKVVFKYKVHYAPSLSPREHAGARAEATLPKADHGTIYNEPRKTIVQIENLTFLI